MLLCLSYELLTQSSHSTHSWRQRVQPDGLSWGPRLITGPLLPSWASLPAPPPPYASLVLYLPIFLLLMSSLLPCCLSSLVFFCFSFLDHVPHTPRCPPGSAACSPYTNNLARSDRPVMGCGSADTEGESPKASQAINDSFPPFSNINRQVT